MRRALVVALCLSALPSCAKSQSVGQCRPERWEGECQLASVTKVVDAALPIPHVVMEAVYEPIANDRYPQFTPGPIAQRTMVKGEYELGLYDYLEAHPRVACAAQAPSPGPCVAPRVVISLAPFDAEAAARTAAVPPVTGCAQIEAESTQDKVRQVQQAQTVIEQRVPFAENSAELPADANELAEQVARTLASRPSIECLGIVGQIASGETPALAEQRAKAVRELLRAHGVSPTRLLTIGATAKVFGTGSKPAEPDPADRRVSFSVLLERAPPPDTP